MQYMTTSEVTQRLDSLLDTIQREPVTIRRHAQEVAVVLSIEAYERLCATNRDELERLCTRLTQQAAERGLTEEKFSTLLAHKP